VGCHGRHWHWVNENEQKATSQILQKEANRKPPSSQCSDSTYG
jgi:hypothetical protein